MKNKIGAGFVNVVSRYIQMIGVRITPSTLRRELEQNTEFPGLSAVSAVLRRFHVENDAFNLADKDLGNIEAPFLASIRTSANQEIVLVESLTPATVRYYDSKGKSVSVPFGAFVSAFNKIIFVAENSEASGEPDYVKKLADEKQFKLKQSLAVCGLLMIPAVMLVALFLSSPANWLVQTQLAAIVLTKISGLVITILMIKYEPGQFNSIIDRICSGKNSGSGCSTMLVEEKILGFRWSEIGFFYFASTFVCLLLPFETIQVRISILSFLGIISSPFIIFSIYQQRFVQKEWCYPCLIVVTILSGEFLWSIRVFSIQDVFSDLLPFAIFFLEAIVPVAGYYLLSPIFRLAEAAPEYMSSFKRLFHNKDVFDLSIKQEPVAPGGWDKVGISLGNPRAENTIIKVCNPFCGPCAKAHPVIEDIINRRADYNTRIIFTASNKPEDFKSAEVVRHFLAIAENFDAARVTQALDYWYSSKVKNYEEFSKRYPVTSDLVSQNEKIDAMETWCNTADISYTPTIFIHNHRLSHDYTVEDLKTILV